MPISFSNDLRNARANQIISAINNGTGSGSLSFYTAPQPAKGVAITSQILLGTLAFAEPAGSVVNGVLTFANMTDDFIIDNDGIAAWARVLDGNGAFVMDMSVTDSAGAGPIKMPSTQLYAGGSLIDTSFVITEGNN
jgi:hypothetical protein